MRSGIVRGWLPGAEGEGWGVPKVQLTQPKRRHSAYSRNVASRFNLAVNAA